MTGMALEPGLTATAEHVVTEEDTAAALGSGDVEVYATPALAALFEQAAVDAVRAALPPGSTSVGTRLELDHLAPSKVGATVRATATLTGVDRARLTFSCEATDGPTVIGRCVHVRAVVDRARFD
jgi:predicted thioesterase